MAKTRRYQKKDNNDPRGRKRDESLNKFADQIEAAYMKDSLPILIKDNKPSTLAKRLRHSTTIVEIQEELGIWFTFFCRESGVEVDVRRG